MARSGSSSWSRAAAAPPRATASLPNLLSLHDSSLCSRVGSPKTCGVPKGASAIDQSADSQGLSVQEVGPAGGRKSVNVHRPRLKAAKPKFP